MWIKAPEHASKDQQKLGYENFSDTPTRNRVNFNNFIRNRYLADTVGF